MLGTQIDLMKLNPIKDHRMLDQNSDKNKSKEAVSGKIIKITGTVIDVQFPQGYTPKINSCLVIEIPEDGIKKTHAARLEVALQLGDDIVRCIAIENVHGISRNLPVYDTGIQLKFR